MKSIVVIPTYNEAANIAATPDAITEAAPYVDVLVVDDNSPDGTAQLVIDHTGFGWALNQGYEVIAQMDAGLSHPPQRLPALIEATHNADMATGSRYVHGGGVNHWSLSRRLISRAGNRYVRLVLGLPVHDTTGGFKALRGEALRSIGALTQLTGRAPALSLPIEVRRGRHDVTA